MTIFLFLNTVLFGVIGFVVSLIICLATGHSLLAHWDIVAAVTGLAGIFPGFFGGILYLYRKDTKGY